MSQQEIQFMYRMQEAYMNNSALDSCFDCPHKGDDIDCESVTMSCRGAEDYADKYYENLENFTQSKAHVLTAFDSVIEEQSDVLCNKLMDSINANEEALAVNDTIGLFIRSKVIDCLKLISEDELQ